MLRYRTFWLFCGAGFIALVVFLSLTPDPVRTPSVDTVDTGHVLAYFWLMLWFAQLSQPGRQRLAVAVALVGLGVGMEYAQRMTGYRTFALSDMRDDAIGVALGALLTWGRGGRLLAAVERWLVS